MRHLFLVKSWITYLVAKAVIRHENIDATDVVLLTVRGFEIDMDEDGGSEFKIVELPFGPGAEKPFPKLEPIGRRNYRITLPHLLRFDWFIAKVTRGRPFHYYSTNTKQRYNRVITTHRRCTGYSFLECGLISYRTLEEIEALYPTTPVRKRERKYYRERIGAKTYYADGYRRVYGVGPLAFPGFERRIELAGVFGHSSIGTLGPDLSQVEVVLVYDGLSAHGLISFDSIAKATRRIFDHFREQQIQTVHFKFHPAQTFSGEDGELELVVRKVAEDIRVERLPGSLVLEELAHAAPHVRFYVNVSSVALYAAQAGCEVISYAPFVAQFEDGFDSTLETLPASWKRSVRFLDV